MARNSTFFYSVSVGCVGCVGILETFLLGILWGLLRFAYTPYTPYTLFFFDEKGVVYNKALRKRTRKRKL